MSHRRFGFVVMLLAINVGFFIQPAAAQQPLGTVAHDYCQMYDWDQGIVCGVLLVAGDGSSSTYVGDGVEPGWSADGSRLAFVGDRHVSEPSLFVMNLADGTVAKLPALDSSIAFVGYPAWSPNGETLAFECEIDAGNRDICAIHTDGTGLVRLTSDPGWASIPRFSVDGSKIGFSNSGPWVVINADGSGITAAAPGDFAVPPGTRTVGVIPFSGGCDADGRICPDTIVIANDDGTYTSIAYGNNPTWALSHQPITAVAFPGCDGLVCAFDASASWIADGTTIVNFSWNFGDGTTGSGVQASHAYAATGTYPVRLTVTTTAGVTSTTGPVSIDVVANRSPVASFTYTCSGSQCGFDGSASSDPDGEVVRYSWYFGDGGGADGPTASHRYEAIGTFPVTLYVTDNDGATRLQQQMIVIASVTNTPPIASFDAGCAGLTCTANAQLSRDPDGGIARYAWTFGDGTTGDGAIVGHTYAAAGTYTITLAVTDNLGATATFTQAVTAVRLPIHVGDLDGAATAVQSKWNATVTITVHDSGHSAVAGVAVTGIWNDGTSANCTTMADGRCAVIKSGVLKTANARFSISTLTHATFVYESTSNHDPDGDSNGGTITVTRR
jgi:PKD repeat protein